MKGNGAITEPWSEDQGASRQGVERTERGESPATHSVTPAPPTRHVCTGLLLIHKGHCEVDKFLQLCLYLCL